MKERNAVQKAAYRLKSKQQCSLSTVLNPLSGQMEQRVLVNKDKILLKTDEVDRCISQYYKKYKGAGARKIYCSIIEKFAGVSERGIQEYINNQPKAQRLNPEFKNKADLVPVKSSGVLNQVQIDLVDMSKYPAPTEGIQYRYILVVLDTFSRFLFLRPLRSKSSSEVANVLLQVFSDIGPPLRIQSDQGTEFKGVVHTLMTSLGVQIIHSAPYHPQSQGKVSLSPLVITSVKVLVLTIN